jgi:hypothetical protein
LLAFGGDSLIELLSASVVLWRFTAPSAHERTEQRAAQIAGVLLLLLAAYVAVISALTFLGYREPKPSLLGICVLVAAAAIMPWLASEKRKLSAATGSAALRADAAESSVCGYLALIALAGLLVNLIWNIGRADSIAALATIPFIVYEARESLRGKACACRGRKKLWFSNRGRISQSQNCHPGGFQSAANRLCDPRGSRSIPVDANGLRFDRHHFTLARQNAASLCNPHRLRRRILRPV